MQVTRIMAQAMKTIQGMSKGEHQYGKYAAPQKHVLTALYKDFTTKALEELLSSESKDVRLADFGASDCMTTTDIYTDIVSKVADKKLRFYIVDLPGNDWETAEQQCGLSGIPVEHHEPGKALTDDDGKGSKFVLVPQSFFSQCLPDNSINISFSSTATHWLSSMPRLQGSIHHHSNIERINVTDLDRLKRISYTDGVNFLVSRTNELVPGGTLLMANVNHDRAGGITVLEVMNDVLERWVRAGRLVQSEVDGLGLPVYNKSVEEWTACFNDERVKVAGLKLQRIKQGLPTPNPYLEETSEYMKFFLGFAEGILLKVLKTHDNLMEFMEEVGGALDEDPKLCEMCEIVWYSDFYLAVKEK